MNRFYDPIVGATTREGRFKRLLLEQASPEPGQRILDLGCGTGTLTILIQESEPAARVQGVDADSEILAQASDKAGRRGLSQIHFEQAFADELPYRESFFDQVVSTLFFHHLTTSGKRGAAAEIARVLRPGGQLHVADWGKPAGLGMRALSLSIRLLDGFEPTRDNFNGRLPEIFEEGGLIDVHQTGQLRTALGTIARYAAKKPAVGMSPGGPIAAGALEPGRGSCSAPGRWSTRRATREV
ncbi:MAG: hypothetical protein BroJett024_43240 [Alphaproteobacteria bacterium]|nr:MAG: hypothetical protein BroJett024_43240 [Alphaproteobacteria bacterium]